MTIALPSTHSPHVPTRLQRLREATGEAHARIEGALPLLDPKLTRRRYGEVIDAFFGFYAGLEPLLHAAVGPHAADIEIDRRGKTSLLCLDLHALGRSAVEIAGLPRCAELPNALNASQALGVLYVLEGATLGGQVIGRALRAALGLEASNGAAFFYGYGDETRAMWRRFSEHLDRAPDLDSEAVVASAVETFEKLRSWLVTAGNS